MTEIETEELMALGDAEFIDRMEADLESQPYPGYFAIARRLMALARAGLPPEPPKEGAAVYEWGWDCGRQGSLDGVFVATVAEVKAAIGEHVDFGEVLGKHSQIYGTLEEKEFSIISTDPEAVKIVAQFGPFGHYPMDLIKKNIDCQQCGEETDVKEEIMYWCPACKIDVCETCSGNGYEPEDAVHKNHECVNWELKPE